MVVLRINNYMNITNDVIKNSGIAFGTSGARGLVKDFTPNVCCIHLCFYRCNDEGFFF